MRIAIAGAGVAGSYISRLLRMRGYRQVDVFDVRHRIACGIHPCGYGVELALLVDTLETVGLDAIAQVDLGVRRHRNHDDHKLGRMASEIWQVALDRLDNEGRVRRRAPLGATLLQFERVEGELVATEHVVAVDVRPPISTIAEYAVEARAHRSAPRAS